MFNLFKNLTDTHKVVLGVLLAAPTIYILLVLAMSF